ncbi:MAG: response regulator [Lachnospiraceae bacterium]|nr:response regulator [Lachnospiraceae bacterium]
MKEKKNREGVSNKNELFITSHMMMILTYTIFSVILIAEIFIMKWELWATFMIVFGVVIAWYIHLSNKGNDHMRLWICSILMMVTFFYYGTHDTSTFDLSVVICVVMFLYTMTGIDSLVTLCQITYYLTMVYEIFNLVTKGTKFDSLTITRTILHFSIVTMTGWIARTIISKWNDVLIQSKEEISTLKDSTRRINDFIANLSHEIRTPINTILGLCAISLSDEKDEEKKANLHAIENAGKKIGNQISDILDYSEIDRKDLANNYEDYMLSSVIYDVVNELDPYRNDDIELIINVDPSVPAIMNTDVSKLKKILWHLISNSLKFTNEGGVYVHISSVPHDYGINLRIQIKDTGIGMDQEQLERIYDEFYCADSGRTRSRGGLGIGMIIVNGFVRSLGGFMIVDSELNKGSSVKVSIPCRIVDPSPCMAVKDRGNISLGAYLHFEKYPNPAVRDYYDSMVRNLVTGLNLVMHRVDNINSLHSLTDNKRLTHLFAGPEEYNDASGFMEKLAKNIIVTIVANPGELELPPDSHVRIMPKPFYSFPVVGVLNSKPEDSLSVNEKISFPGVRTLIVDDEPMNLVVSAGIFDKYDMIVTTCGSGREAIELCRSNDYDIIFMDHMMPEMDGVEATKRIRSEHSRKMLNTPIIAFTANALSSTRAMFRDAGFDGFVSKPVDRVELERVLKNVLSTKILVTDTDTAAIIRTADREGEKICDAASAVRNLAAAGLDTEKGLFYCQNDTGFYLTILAQYLKESDSKKSIIKESLGSGDLKNYAIQVHSIKSTSKMIGAMKLSEKARLLEIASKNDDRAYVDNEHEEMMTMYDNLLDILRQNIPSVDSPSVDSSSVDNPSVDISPVDISPVDISPVDSHSLDSHSLDSSSVDSHSVASSHEDSNSGFDTDMDEDSVFEFEPSGDPMKGGTLQ